jgi:hypothetical protein
MPIEQSWRDWIAFEQTFQRRNITAIREHPTTPYRDVSREALGSLSRAYVDPERRRIYAGLNYPGTVGYLAAIGLDDGRVEHLQDIKQPRIYTVTSLAYDPAAQTLFYTADNAAYRDLIAIDTTTRRQRTLLKDARIGDLSFNRAEPITVGDPDFQRYLHAGADPGAVHQLERHLLVALWRNGVRPRRLAGRRAGIGIGRRDRRQTGRPRHEGRVAHERRHDGL